MSNQHVGLALAALCAASSLVAADPVVYFQNFNSSLVGFPEWTGVTGTTGVVGFSTLPADGSSNLPVAFRTFSQGMLHNATGGNIGNGTFIGDPGSPSILTLTGLPSHTGLSIGFLLAVVDSWDGSLNFPVSPDFFEIKVDGTVVFSHTFAIASSFGTYTGGSMSGLLNNSSSGQPNLGFNFWGDEGYDLSLATGLQAISHTSATAVIEFRAFGGGWQGGIDESWGMDNLEIGVIIPLPTSAGLALFGCVAGLSVRRRN